MLCLARDSSNHTSLDQYLQVYIHVEGNTDMWPCVYTCKRRPGVCRWRTTTCMARTHTLPGVRGCLENYRDPPPPCRSVCLCGGGLSRRRCLCSSRPRPPHCVPCMYRCRCISLWALGMSFSVCHSCLSIHLRKKSAPARRSGEKAFGCLFT